MIDPFEFLDELQHQGVSFFSGVPDSLLKHFNEAVVRKIDSGSHIVAANEGAAVGLAAGHFLASGDPGLVYLQNSGLGNTVNPLLSLVSPDLYGVPVILMIGWRGEPGVSDEPQHVHQGKVTEDLLETMSVPVWKLNGDTVDWKEPLRDAVSSAGSQRQAVALVVSKNTFLPPPARHVDDQPWSEMTRGEALTTILDHTPHDGVVVATTGYTGRELDFARTNRNEATDGDFLVVGSMGHASSIATGLALGRSERRVVCIDGDGSVAMHMGSLAQNGRANPDNLVHLVLNNGVHESVGGQPTVADQTNLPAVAENCGYRTSVSVSDQNSLSLRLKEAMAQQGPTFIEIRIRSGAPSGLPRPTDLKDRIATIRSFLDG